jgi:hypothetical protein
LGGFERSGSSQRSCRCENGVGGKPMARVGDEAGNGQQLARHRVLGGARRGAGAVIDVE